MTLVFHMRTSIKKELDYSVSKHVIFVVVVFFSFLAQLHQTAVGQDAVAALTWSHFGRAWLAESLGLLGHPGCRGL